MKAKSESINSRNFSANQISYLLRGKFFFVFFLFIFSALYAQEDIHVSDDLVMEQIIPEAEPLSPENQRFEMEIKTSTLAELAAWCRTLGLSEGGTRDDLSRRLREHFKIPLPEGTSAGQKLITIEHAHTSEYFSLDIIGEDYARLKGEVNIHLVDGDAVHKIRADEILFNRTRNIITASGKVVYEKIESDQTETFRGENITVNIDTWASVFLEGNTERKIDNQGAAYLFSGNVISRTNQDTTILTNARITSAYDDDALWSIISSKLWLLPGSDFAIVNAVLKVGEIPVLYIPFLYYPADELIFHPVLGFRSREGAFIQTTTYIFGQPKADSSEENSLTRIMGHSNDEVKEIQGLFLRNTGKKLVEQNELSLKLLTDYYVNLGLYIGAELTVPKTGILNPLEYSLGFGFSRTVFLRGDGFTPYVQDNGIHDNTFDWNYSHFFSLPVPFRYRMHFQSSINGKYGTLSWNFPYYSDPYVNNDFQIRSEKMDYMNMIQQGAAFGFDSTAQNEISSYQWQLNGNLNPSIQLLAPYVTRFSVTNLSTSIIFRSIKDENIYSTNPYSPMRDFYAPDKYTIYNISANISGNPLTIGGTNTRQSGSASSAEINDPFNGIGTPISPWAGGNTSERTVGSQSSQITQVNISPSESMVPPALTQSFNMPRAGNLRFSIDYQITPTSSTELQFMINNLKSYDDVDWKMQSILTSVGGNTNLNFRADHTSGLFTNTLSFTGNGTWRNYNYLNEEAYRRIDGTIDTDRMDEDRRRQYSQTNYSTFYAYNGSVRPLIDNSIFSQSNIQYNFRGTLVRSRRYSAANSPDGPDLTAQWGSWVKEERRNNEDILGLTSHRLSANIAANIMDNQQSLSFSTDLPPLDELIITSATFRYWISETNFNFRIERPSADGVKGEWKFKPFYFTETLRFNGIGSFSFYMVIDPESNHEINNLSTSVSIWNFRTSFTALKIARSEFNLLTGWVQYGEPVFLAKELAFSYNNAVLKREFFNNKLNFTFNINTSLSFDLQQHTNSNFSLILEVNLRVQNFIEFSLSSRSRNSVIWRYLKNMPGFEDLTNMYNDGPQNNIFIDLFDSFNFFNDDKRRRSGFKIERFDLKATHFLGDWHADLTVSMYPWRDAADPVSGFKIVADVNFLIQWKPIKEIKSDIGYDGKTDRWAVKQ